ncbi:MAG: bifunctional diaminohydroxyphosphoribosylaminopyrimidine deaminase/5-amino-6-(5-phosphoribosylamino)uracil reductase RibD [Oligoflexales bacterium]
MFNTFTNLNQAPIDTWQDLTSSVQIGQKITHQNCCQLAAATALQGIGWVSPNPLVGAVFVCKDGRLLGYGAHKQYKYEHAERNALKNIDPSELEGGTAYVTLEPCSHQGHQPSCAQLLKPLKLKTIFYGQQDPNPKVAGQGLHILRKAGMKCQQDPLLHELSTRLTEAFFHNLKTKKPYVAMKVACSLDGKAAYPGDSRHFLTGSRSRQYGHWLRQFYDAIVVGADTVLQDNPTLNVRLDNLRISHPLRVVLDPKGKAFKPGLNLTQTQEQRTLWMTCEKTLPIQGVEHIQLPLCGTRFDVDSLLTTLWDQGIRSLLLEGGSYLWESFLNEHAVQKLHLFQAPQILGSQGICWSGRHAFQAPMIIKNPNTLSLDQDILTEGNVEYG